MNYTSDSLCQNKCPKFSLRVMEFLKTWYRTLNIHVASELLSEAPKLKQLLETLALELEVLSDQVFIQTGVVVTFQSTISGGFSHAVKPPWIVRLEMLFFARTLAIPNC